MPQLVRSRSNKHFDALDELRGVAAIMVLLGHASAVMLGPHHTFVHRKTLAVVFFFMLSGFVVASAYDGRLRRGYSVREFLVRRAIRLYPMIFAGTVLSTFACARFEPAFSHGWRGPAAAIAAMVGVPCPRTDFNAWTRFPIDPPEWSLFYEGLVYILFAFLLVRLSAAALLGLVAVALAIYTWADARYFLSEVPFPLLSCSAIAAFGIGVLLLRLHEAKQLPEIPLPFALLGAIIVLMCVVPARFGPLPNTMAFVVFCPLVIVSAASCGRRDATWSERTLGELSFPVYIVHWPFLTFAHRVLQPRLGAPAAIAGGMALAVIAGWTLFRLYDQPLRRRLISAFVRGRAAGPPFAISVRVDP